MCRSYCNIDEVANSRSPHTLELSRQQMQALGYSVVDTLVEHFETLRQKPPTRTGERPDLEGRLREAPPEPPAEPARLIEQLQRDVFSNMMHVDHPRFFAFVPSPGNFVGAMADALASGFNPFVGTWLAGSGPAQLELVTIDWLREICGMPESAGGLFLSGGSMANLTALAVARHARLAGSAERARVYYSDQTHSSVDRALRVLGFGSGQIRRLPSDESYRLSMPELARAVAADRAAGDLPFCAVANAGTTNTGAVDPLVEMADFCRGQGLWLHTDGAYGAAAMLIERGRAALAGLERSDSLSLDPHKWLFQPFEIGCVLLRDRRLLQDVFRILPDYLQDAHRLREEVNFCDHGIQLTRGFRALKLWLSFKVFGLAAFRDAVAWGFELAEIAERRLRQAPCWEILSPAQMAIVAFRYAAPGRTGERLEQVNRRLVGAMMAEGFAMLSSTALRGRTALRLCTINPRTTAAEIEETIARLERHAAAL
jgi:glutamate/tyrosine decarboxylase-like PLP-dependent enzyme